MVVGAVGAHFLLIVLLLLNYYVLQQVLMCQTKKNPLISLIILWQTHEATRVFEHLVSLGLKSNAKSYSLLVDAHLINRDVKSALAVIDDMVTALFFFFLKKLVYFANKGH